MTGTTSPLVVPAYLREAADQRTPVAHPAYRSTGLRAPLRTPSTCRTG
ncbi:hypothetical protein ACFQX8_25885 [Klenkia terrae]